MLWLFTQLHKNVHCPEYVLLFYFNQSSPFSFRSIYLSLWTSSLICVSPLLMHHRLRHQRQWQPPLGIRTPAPNTHTHKKQTKARRLTLNLKHVNETDKECKYNSNIVHVWSLFWFKVNTLRRIWILKIISSWCIWVQVEYLSGLSSMTPLSSIGTAKGRVCGFLNLWLKLEQLWKEIGVWHMHLWERLF